MIVVVKFVVFLLFWAIWILCALMRLDDYLLRSREKKQLASELELAIPYLQSFDTELPKLVPEFATKPDQLKLGRAFTVERGVKTPLVSHCILGELSPG